MFNDLRTAPAPVALGGWSAGGLLWEIGDVGGAVKEAKTLRGVGFVVGGEETVGVADQDAAILVIDPRGDGLVVHAGHDAL